MPSTKRAVDAFGGNMPFLGGRRIATQHGDRYAEWLTELYGGTGDTDYVGYFFHRAGQLMAPAGSIGFIATNAIADGDNRRTVLGQLLAQPEPFRIYAAETGRPWPGNAQVLVSTLFLERGLPDDVAWPRYLDGRRVDAINSRLRSGAEWPEPQPLDENANLALVGCFLRGTGFILEPDEAEALLAAHPEEGEVVRPFLTGDDLSNTVEQTAQRYVVDFRDLTLEEARRFPHALGIVEERVRPGRERLKATGADAEHRKYWWRFANVRKELRDRASEVPRLLATARVSKHSTFAFVPANWTPSEQVVVFPLPSFTAFAVLQSRVHRVWVELQATHMGEGIRYSASECFATFPFPDRDPRAELPALEEIGRRLYESRAEFMRERQIGLNQTYNLLGDPGENDEEIADLRTLHGELDAAVLGAYGWSDLAVPPTGEDERAFEDAVAGRLFAQNQRRAEAGREAESAGTGGSEVTKAIGPGPRKVMTPRARGEKRTGGSRR